MKLNGKPKNESFGFPPPTITVPHDLQPQPLDLGVHEESEDDDPGIDEGRVAILGKSHPGKLVK